MGQSNIYLLKSQQYEDKEILLQFIQNLKED